MSSVVKKSNVIETNATGAVISILFNTLILTYVMKLEDKLCNCIMDWRHEFLKYFSGILIVKSFLMLLVKDIPNNMMMMTLRSILMAGGLVNFWCLYTYVGDLDRTNCQCAISKQKDLHYFLYTIRYLMLISIVLTLIGVIIMSARS